MKISVEHRTLMEFITCEIMIPFVLQTEKLPAQKSLYKQICFIFQVRIAVRTLTLNVYRVDDKSMIQFIRAKTAAPYFSNLVWFIGNHILELDACVRNDAE
jgi:hypothetical protein